VFNEASVPNEFVCPITLEIMTDPVIAKDGNSYERSAIEDALQRRQICPKNNITPCTVADLISNINLRNAIQTWQAEQDRQAKESRQQTEEAKQTGQAKQAGETKQSKKRKKTKAPSNQSTTTTSETTTQEQSAYLSTNTKWLLAVGVTAITATLGVLYCYYNGTLPPIPEAASTVVPETVSTLISIPEPVKQFAKASLEAAAATLPPLSFFTPTPSVIPTLFPVAPESISPTKPASIKPMPSSKPTPIKPTPSSKPTPAKTSGDKSEAINRLKIAATLNNEGAKLEAQDDFRGAWDKYKEALSHINESGLDDDVARQAKATIIFNLGAIRGQEGRALTKLAQQDLWAAIESEDARDYINEVLSLDLDPDNIEKRSKKTIFTKKELSQERQALLNNDNFLGARKKYEEALPYLEEALRLNPNHGKSHNHRLKILLNLGTTYAEEGTTLFYFKQDLSRILKNFETALLYYDKILSSDTNNSSAKNGKKIIFRMIERNSELNKLWKEKNAQTPTPRPRM
jgi:tetratricopeptide (TPR) repeat protein